MHYTIYKITNTLNGKIYIGKHQTNDLNDVYLGSGKLLKKAIEKYGQEVFTKEILFDFDNESEMNAKEKELVTIQFCSQYLTYNLCPGGHGGFGYINSSIELRIQKNRLARQRANANGALEKAHDALSLLRKNVAWNKKLQEKRKIALIQKYGKCGVPSFLGKTHTKEAKDKISATMKGKGVGKNNSQFGTCWMNHPELGNKKVKATDVDDYASIGYKKGRKIKG